MMNRFAVQYILTLDIEVPEPTDFNTIINETRIAVKDAIAHIEPSNFLDIAPTKCEIMGLRLDGIVGLEVDESAVAEESEELA